VAPRRDIARLADEGYGKNVIAFRCIEEVARSVACVPLNVFRERADGAREQIVDHPLVRLLRRPNPDQSRPALIHELVGHYLIAGNSYLEAVGPGGPSAGGSGPQAGKQPHELWVKRPDRMRPVSGRAGIAAYEFRTGSGVVRWTVDQVTGRSAILHLKTFNPLDDFLGLSPIESAALNIDQHNEIDAWNLGLLRNQAAPSGTLETDQALDEDQLRRLRLQFTDTYAGGGNAGKNLVLEAGLKWKGLGFNLQQMAIIEAKGATARFICQAFGVPAFLLGLPEGATFNNVAEARLALWDQTVIPLLDKIVAELNNWLAPMFNDDGVTISPDLDRVTALEPRRQAKWERIRAADFLTINERRQALGFDEVPGGDSVLVSATLFPLGDSGLNEAKEAADQLDLGAGEVEPGRGHQGAGPSRARPLATPASDKPNGQGG
jgi:HK97 family phage portal protein